MRALKLYEARKIATAYVKTHNIMQLNSHQAHHAGDSQLEATSHYSCVVLLFKIVIPISRYLSFLKPICSLKPLGLKHLLIGV